MKATLPTHQLDTKGLICPEPVMLLHKAIRQAKGGEIIEILATDPATTRDIPNFCRHLGHTLIAEESDACSDKQQTDGEGESLIYRYLVQKKQH